MTTKKLKRVESAKERQKIYDSLSTTQKIALLNSKLGIDVGAKKQRAKLALLLEKEKEEKVLESKKEEKQKKNYQKPKRS